MKTIRALFNRYGLEIGIILALTGLGTMVLFAVILPFNDWSFNPNSNLFSNYGSFISGVAGSLFSLAGFILLYLTLQYQKTTSLKESIESKFYTLIELHRNNVNEFQIKEYQGRKLFIYMRRELLACYDLIEIAYEAYLEMLRYTGQNERLQHFQKIKQAEIINLAYVCFFFGAIGDDSKLIIGKYLVQYDSSFVNDVEKIFKTQKNEQEKFGYIPYALFDGHQVRLAHYFRHLFQTVKFIDKQPKTLLSYAEKYDYIKTLRAQLSNQEQVVFFYNSLSVLGIPWEKEETNFDYNKHLITKYNLIKNIPVGFSGKIEPRKFYPDVEYEGDKEPTENKKRLIQAYF